MRRILALLGIAALFGLGGVFDTAAVSNGYGHQPLTILFLVPAAAWYVICGIRVVQEWERVPIMLFGKYLGTLNPGLGWVDPIFFSTLQPINVQDITRDVKVEGAQTKNNIGISVIGLLTFRVDKAKVRNAVVEVHDVLNSVLNRASATLAGVVGTKELNDLLEHREVFTQSIKDQLIPRLENWGVVITAFELKDIIIKDPQIAEAIAMKARADQEAQAELVRADRQKQIAEALNAAASAYSAEGKWLKELEVLIELCRSANNNTIILPANLTQALSKLQTPLAAA